MQHVVPLLKIGIGSQLKAVIYGVQFADDSFSMKRKIYDDVLWFHVRYAA